MKSEKERPMEYSKLIDLVDDVSGLRASRSLKTRDGDQYRVVQISPRSAVVIVEGSEDLELTLTTESGDIFTVEKSVVDKIIDYGVKAAKLGAKLISGKCYLKNKQVATFDPKTGNMTGFKNETWVVCD